MTEIFDASTNDAAKKPNKKGSTTAANGGPTEKPKPHRHVDEYSEVMRCETPASNPLQSFLPKPENVFFDSQLHNEHVLLVLRRHPITQVGWVVIAILLALAPILFSYTPFLSFLPARFSFAALIGWYLLVIGFVLESFLTWFYNVYIITDERVIDVDFYSLLFKNVSSAHIANIEDITTTAGGTLSAIFNFGTVTIQTAATQQEFEFEDVPQPARVAAFLNELMQEEEREELEGRVS